MLTGAPLLGGAVGPPGPGILGKPVGGGGGGLLYRTEKTKPSGLVNLQCFQTYFIFIFFDDLMKNTFTKSNNNKNTDLLFRFVQVNPSVLVFIPHNLTKISKVSTKSTH